jgi:hypothetical protein
LEDIDRVSNTAGVQMRFLRDSMTAHCGDQEVAWVKNFNKLKLEGCPGLVIEGLDNPDSRCQAIAAALLRNYIDARVIPIGTLISSRESEETLNPTVLVVPNFFVQVSGKSMPSWKMQTMYDVLVQRAVRNKPSVLYVQSLAEFRKSFGLAFSDFLSTFKVVTA